MMHACMYAHRKGTTNGNNNGSGIGGGAERIDVIERWLRVCLVRIERTKDKHETSPDDGTRELRLLIMTLPLPWWIQDAQPHPS